MAKPVVLQYVGPFDEVYVPVLGASVKRGASVDVAADIAGTPAGPWRPVTADDSLDWPQRIGADGSTTETHDPGAGLLAQADAWQPAATTEKG